MIQAAPCFLDIEQAMNHRGANTRGWLSANDAQCFVDSVYRIPDNGTVVVIGIYAGAQLILARIVKPNATVVGIDPFTNDTEWKSNGRHLRDVCLENLNKAGVLDSITLIEGLSQNVGTTWDKPIDLLLVDGDHREDMALLDLQLFAPHVKVGGLLAIDDMNEASEVCPAYVRWMASEDQTGRKWSVERQTQGEGPDKMWLLRRTA